MKKVGDLLNIYFDDVQKRQGEAYNNFHNSWIKIAGDKIGNNTFIKDIEDGKLIIEIDHPGWKQLIQIKEKQILYHIKKKFPELCVNKIVYHFKNSGKKQIKLGSKENIEVSKSNKVVIEDSNFSELLKKMSKRSEE